MYITCPVGTHKFRMHGCPKIVNGKWHDVTANGTEVVMCKLKGQQSEWEFCTVHTTICCDVMPFPINH